MKLPLGFRLGCGTPLQDVGDGTYRVPVAGTYQVRAVMHRYVPTGRFEEVPNPRYRFWKPWRPKTIVREIYEQIDTLDATEILKFDGGEIIKLDTPGTKTGDEDGSRQ